MLSQSPIKFTVQLAPNPDHPPRLNLCSDHLTPPLLLLTITPIHHIIKPQLIHRVRRTSLDLRPLGQTPIHDLQFRRIRILIRTQHLSRLELTGVVDLLHPHFDRQALDVRRVVVDGDAFRGAVDGEVGVEIRDAVDAGFVGDVEGVAGVAGGGGGFLVAAFEGC